MKSFDLMIFFLILICSFFLGLILFDEKFDSYSDLITFLSIMIGFKITSLSILFNSPLKQALYDRKNKVYKTELHRLRAFYMHSLYFEVISICILFLNFSLKYMVITPIILGTVYCYYKITSDLLRIFTIPTNH